MLMGNCILSTHLFFLPHEGISWWHALPPHPPISTSTGYSNWNPCRWPRGVTACAVWLSRHPQTLCLAASTYFTLISTCYQEAIRGLDGAKCSTPWSRSAGITRQSELFSCQSLQSEAVSPDGGTAAQGQGRYYAGRQPESH